MCPAKDYVKSMKRQATDGDKVFANHICNKRLATSMHKELSKFNIKKITQLSKTWANDLNRHFTDTEKSKQKDAQRYRS